jgi:type IV pilus assembly protein PilX
MKKPIHLPREQNGAALVIGLLLLTVITLLAITGMNSASTELVMAGNEQYRTSAFEASEAGIEQALSTLQLVPLDGTPRNVPATLLPGSTTDRYATTTTHMGVVNIVSGASMNKFIAHYFEINSVGTSARNAQSVHAQGAYYLSAAPSGGP